MLDLKSIFYLLTDAETAEARFKHSRMLQFFDRPEQNLSMSSVEKSLIAISPEREPNFDSFNLAKIQETSAQSIGQICDLMSSGNRPHVLATIPLALSNEVYAKLSDLNYKVFQCRRNTEDSSQSQNTALPGAWIKTSFCARSSFVQRQRIKPEKLRLSVSLQSNFLEKVTAAFCQGTM